MYERPKELDIFFKALFNFKKVRTLGEGAFGLAVLAFDETEQIHKVFKLPKSEKTTHALKMEGKNLVKLRNLLHKNIIQLHQYGCAEIEEDGCREQRYYLCLAFGGTSLREKVGDLKVKLDPEGNQHFHGSGHCLAVEEALGIAIDVCQGLEAAHGFQDSDIRIIHRDIKPENILIDDDTGVARITDFGVSRVIDRSTGMASVAGTLLYMDPECFKGKAGTYSDIYSFGLVLYEMLTGELPFSDFPSRLERPAADPRQYNADISDELAGIMLKAINKDLSERYANAPEILKDLRRVHAALNPVPPRYKRIRTVFPGCFLCKDRKTGERVSVRIVESDATPDEMEKEVGKLLSNDTACSSADTVAKIVRPLRFFQNQHLLGVVSPPPNGQTFAETFRRTPIHSPDILKEFCEQMALVCDVVANANATGVMHGFLSPRLIYSDGQGNLTLHGFGAGPMFRYRQSTGKGVETFLRTFSDHLAFMSPEILRGATSPTLADDVFSIGAIMYSVLVGRPHAEMEILEKLVSGTFVTRTLQDPRQANSLITRRLASIILKALEWDGHNRQADTREIAASLRQCRWPEDIVDSLVEDALQTYEAGDLLEACDMIQKALEADPGNPRIHFTRGLIYYREQDYKWAVEELQKAINVEPGRDAYVVLGRCYLEWNRQNDKAAEMFGNALQYGDDEEVRNLHAKAVRGVEDPYAKQIEGSTQRDSFTLW